MPFAMATVHVKTMWEHRPPATPHFAIPSVPVTMVRVQLRMGTVPVAVALAHDARMTGPSAM